jgi:hypothetical protein
MLMTRIVKGSKLGPKKIYTFSLGTVVGARTKVYLSGERLNPTKGRNGPWISNSRAGIVVLMTNDYTVLDEAFYDRQRPDKLTTVERFYPKVEVLGQNL